MSDPSRVAQPPPRPLLVWDGDCRFCGAWVRRWRAGTGDRVDYAPYQEVGARFPELAAADFQRAVRLILPDGRVLRAAEAVFATRAFGLRPRDAWAICLYQKFTAFAWASEAGYARVARHRMFFSWLTRLGWGEPAPSTYRFSGFLFMRALGLVFLVAFLSFAGQAGGLVGEHGIIPLHDYFASIAQAAPAAGDRFALAPSLLWFAPNDTGLYALLGVGSVCAALVMTGLAPGWALLGCVLAYDSLRAGVPIFLNYQWDALLVETGAVALLLASWGWAQSAASAREPPAAGRWAVWFLLFKLMFLSGLVKILTNGGGPGPAHPDAFRQFMAWLTGVPVGENTWLDGTALQFHYFTQPIPDAISWWLAQRPAWFQAWSLWAMMAVELVVPFGFFGPRRVRHFAALAQIIFQVALLVSGNYGFFNLLTLVLCLPLFDDAFWPARVQKLLARRPPAAEIIPLGRRKQIAGWARGLVAGAVIFIGVIQIDEAWRNRTRAEPPPPPGALAQFLDELSGRAQQLGLVNSYGLFRVMTTERPELTIEGSDDGATWRPYEFYWKPGDPMRPPSFATPHMPRLDWQMWFAALDIYYGHQVPGWLPALLAQLQQGNPQVLALFEHNPFPQAPPKLLRLRLDLYRFTTPAEHAKTGAWWSITPHPEFTMTWSPR